MNTKFAKIQQDKIKQLDKEIEEITEKIEKEDSINEDELKLREKLSLQIFAKDLLQRKLDERIQKMMHMVRN